MSEEVNINLAPLVRVDHLPADAREAFKVSRALAAFWRANTLKDPRWSASFANLKSAYFAALKGLEGAVGDIPIQLLEHQTWTADDLKKKSNLLWKFGLVALRNKEARMEYHPETLNLEERPTSDASLNVKFNSADFPAQEE